MLFEYKDLSFSEHKDRIKVNFLSIYHFYLDRKELEGLGLVRIERNAVEFASSKKEENLRQKFLFMLSRGFDELRCSINGKPVLYIHRNSGIPLLGSGNFGIIDRGTNTIEIKPLTTCNIDCIFCSVDHSKRISDIVVERSYLVDELKKVIALKENRVNIHIGSQGDPSLYGDLEGLVADIRDIKQVSAISMVTNGLLITKQRAQALIDAGMTHFHISLHSTDQEMADKLANSKYPVKKVMDVCRYISGRAHLLLVPVWVPGINDKDIEDIIMFGKELGAGLGIQNFLEYKFGKKPANPVPMKVFFQRINELEKRLDVDLTTLSGDLKIVPDIKIEKPFRKGQIIKVGIKSEDRMRNTRIAVASERVVSVVNCEKTSGNLRVKLIRDKDGIFVGMPVR
jgi:uncharacterized protein